MSDSQSSQATSSTKTIRNFLYVDEDQVNSLASQIFGGVAESVVRSTGAERERTTEQKGRLTSGRSSSRTDLEAQRLSEQRVMYDRVYSRLEEALAETITSPGELHFETVHTSVSPGDYVLVEGDTMLEDHAMLGQIFARWTEIADALVAASIAEEYGRGAEEMLSEAKKTFNEQIEKTEDGTRQSILEQKRDALPADIDELEERKKEEIGMHQEAEWIEKHLALFNDLFHGRASALSLIRDQDTKVQFRAPLTERHLRVGKEHIRTLHNGSEIGEWSIVGKVTSVPNRYDNSSFEEVSAEESEHMRDHFRSMMSSVEDVFEMIYNSEEVSEVILTPLAVYQETTVAVSSE